MKLLPFQEEAVTQMVQVLQSRGGVYNASEMGLGKSAMAISAINRIPTINSILVICPAIVRLVWEAELEKWRTRDYAVCCISYNEAANKPEVYKALDYDCLLLDEAHYLKSTKAKRTKAILGDLWPPSFFRCASTPITAFCTAFCH